MFQDVVQIYIFVCKVCIIEPTVDVMYSPINTHE